MFSIILPGRPCLTNMTTISANQFAFTFSSTPHFSHVVVFMLPGNQLPPDTAAGVYMQLPGEQGFKFLGAIANEKQSAIFKVRLPGTDTATGGGDIDAMSDGMVSGGGANAVGATAGDVNVGISVEPTANIQAQMQQLQAQLQQAKASSMGAAAMGIGAAGSQHQQPSTKVLAQRIIKNAFNFLSSFSGNAGGTEVVPLKSFQDWWSKFERKIENDPGFLERDDGS